MQRFHPRSWRDEVAALSPLQRRILLGVLIALGLLVVVPLAFGAYFLASAPRFPRPPYTQPSRLYGRSTHLAVGATYDPADLVAELAEEGYREVPAFNDEPYAHHWFEKTL